MLKNLRKLVSKSAFYKAAKLIFANIIIIIDIANYFSNYY